MINQKNQEKKVFLENLSVMSNDKVNQKYSVFSLCQCFKHHYQLFNDDRLASSFFDVADYNCVGYILQLFINLQPKKKN